MRKPTNSAALDEFSARIAHKKLAPLWERLANLVPPEPEVEALPHLWTYATVKHLLLEAAGLITAEDAERRVLILENPGLAGASAATNTLFAGLQLIMPGEIARSHRHTQAAIRFVVEGEHAYTSIDGERADMSPGDLILTPSWRWHDHSHEGDAPVIWLDVLDLPLIRSIGSRFVEPYPEQRVPLRKSSSGHSFSANLAPVDAAPSQDQSILRFPFEPARQALEQMKAGSECDPSYGFKMEYIDPVTRGSVTPTISAFLQLLPSGFEGTRYRSSDGAIYCAVSGRGTVIAGRDDAVEEFSYGPGDVFTIPCWCEHAFTAGEESVLFSASDRGLQTHLGIWRERRN